MLKTHKTAGLGALLKSQSYILHTLPKTTTEGFESLNFESRVKIVT
jgi:hypothetical protein